MVKQFGNSDYDLCLQDPTKVLDYDYEVIGEFLIKDNVVEVVDCMSVFALKILKRIKLDNFFISLICVRLESKDQTSLIGVEALQEFYNNNIDGASPVTLYRLLDRSGSAQLDDVIEINKILRKTNTNLCGTHDERLSGLYLIAKTCDGKQPATDVGQIPWVVTELLRRDFTVFKIGTGSEELV